MKYDKIIKLHQSQPIIKKDEITLKFMGDLFLNNKQKGTLFGKTVKISKYNNNLDIRKRKLYFDLDDGLIIAEGLSNAYNNKGLLEDINELIITGGTKCFEGVSGKVITKRLETNEYEQIIFINWCKK